MYKYLFVYVEEKLNYNDRNVDPNMHLVHSDLRIYRISFDILDIGITSDFHSACKLTQTLWSIWSWLVPSTQTSYNRNGRQNCVLERSEIKPNAIITFTYKGVFTANYSLFDKPLHLLRTIFRWLKLLIGLFVQFSIRWLHIFMFKGDISPLIWYE